MSQDRDPTSPLEVVERFYELLNQKDLEGVLELLDEDVEWIVPAATSIEPEVFRGHEGFRRDAEQFASTWSEITVQVEELTMCDGHVVADVCWVGTATTSGVPVRMRLGAVWTVIGGKVKRFEHHADAAGARRAAGAMP